MAFKRLKGDPGRLISLTLDSELLKDNPLGDPARREFHVWLPPGYDEARTDKRFPVLYDLAGYTGSGFSHTNWSAFDENVPERAARLIHQGKMPPVIIVFPDCFTALGGNQYINSSALGPYADYLTREVIPFVDDELHTLADRRHRGCFGKSSGGYGAIVHGMKYWRYWGAVANHSGDAAFSLVYGSDWPNTLALLSRFRDRASPRSRGWDSGADACLAEGLDDGRVANFLTYIGRRARPSSAEVHALMNLAMAATYDPDPDAPNGFRVPYHMESGVRLEQRWKAWEKHDPVRIAAGRAGENLRRLETVYIDCGWRDQYHIQFGCRQLSSVLTDRDIPHQYEEFDGTHSGIDHRMDLSLPLLAKSLSP